MPVIKSITIRRGEGDSLKRFHIELGRTFEAHGQDDPRYMITVTSDEGCVSQRIFSDKVEEPGAHLAFIEECLWRMDLHPKPGAYVLPDSLPNRATDRRCSAWYLQEQFTAGQYLIEITRGSPEMWDCNLHVYIRPTGGLWPDRTGPVHGRLMPERDPETGGFSWRWQDDRESKACEALFELLVPDPGLRGELEFARIHDHVEPLEVLLRLERAGAIDLKAVRVAIAAERERMEEQEQ